MEARLSQHICFKTAKKKRGESPERRLANHPCKISIEGTENLMDFIDEDMPYCVLTPPALKAEVTGKSFLFLPKMDSRERLTSTPNQDCPQPQAHASNYIDEGFSFSPTGFVSQGVDMMRLRNRDKKEDVEDIRSVLFPSRHLKQKDACHSEGSTSSLFEDICGSKRRPSSKSFRAVINSPVELTSSKQLSSPKSKKQQQQCHAQSLQDSGIGSFMGTVNDSGSQLGEKSLPSSPLKRRAENNETITTLESPMKRLAFVHTSSSPPNFYESLNKTEMSKPGASFLDYSDFQSTPGEALSNASLPPPIFANSIPFVSLKKDFDAPLTYANSCKVEDSLKDFEFAKPSVRPPKARGKTREKYAFKALDATSGSHAGERFFDIITALAERNLHHIVAKIFQDIRQKDVLRCSHVSQSWASICQENNFSRGTIKALKKQYRNEEFNRGSENFTAKDAVENALLKSPAKIGSLRNLSSGRSALSNLQAKAKRTPTKKPFMPKTPSGKNHFVHAESKFEHHQGVKRSLNFGETTRLCPRCGWTAKVYDGDDHKGQCYRFECRHTFCTLCSMKHHYPHPCRMKTSTSPKEEEKTVKAGSKRSKARLKKRLLL